MARRRRALWIIGGGVIVAVVVLAISTSRTEEPTASSPTVASTATPSARLASRPPSVEADPSRAAGVIAGRVVNALSGQGIASAQMSIRSDAGGEVVSEADANGAFTIEPPTPGSYHVKVVAAAGFEPYAIERSPIITVVARAGMRITGVVLSVVPTAEYTCVVHDAGDQPVDGAVVRVSDDSSESRTFTTDARGEVRVQATMAMLVEASHPTAGRGRARVEVADAIDHRIVIRLVAVEVGRDITGHVVDARGKPVPHALVRAMHVMMSQHPRGEVRADGTGAFRIADLDAGLHVVWVACDGCSSSRVRASAGDDITLVVGAGGTLAGQVIDGNDRPVPAFTIRLLRPRGMREVLLEEHEVIDADGRFELTGVDPDDYVLRAVAVGLAPSESVPVTLAGERSEVVIRVLAGGTITGIITDRATGRAIANATVMIDRMPGQSGTNAATSDATGAFALTGVAPGMVSVRAVAPDHHAALASGLRSEDGKTITRDLQLGPLVPGEAPGTDVTGIGAALAGRGEVLVISDLVPGAGAETAGLVAGDAIVKIDGQSVLDLGIREAMEHVRGPAGTRVVLTVRRKDNGPTEDVTVERTAFRSRRS